MGAGRECTRAHDVLRGDPTHSLLVECDKTFGAIQNERASVLQFCRHVASVIDP